MRFELKSTAEERLQKLPAQAGLGSRRANAEDLALTDFFTPYFNRPTI